MTIEGGVVNHRVGAERDRRERQHRGRGAEGRIRWVSVVGVLVLAAGLLTACIPPRPGTGRQPNPAFCDKVKKNTIVVSQGAQMYCFGAQTAQSTPRPNAPRTNAPVLTPANVPASNLTEDVAPSGTRGYGQAETSVAVSGQYAVEAWNDATGFFSPCGSPQYKEELTGYAFSADGGKTFLDMGGLPNNHCDGPVGSSTAVIRAWRLRRSAA